MTNNYHEPIPKGAPGYSWIPNRCFADLDEALGRAALQTDSDDNVNLGRGDYTGHHLILNGGHLWVDSQGNLRFSGSAPASDNGGTLLPKAPPTPPPPETGGDITDPVLTTPVRMQQLRGNFTHAFSLLAIGDDGLLVGTGQDGRYGAAYVWGSDTPTVAGSFRSYQGFSDRFVYTFEDAGSALLIGTGPLGNVYRSTDRGQTWQLTGKLRTRSEQGGGAEVRAIKHIGNGVVLAVASLTRRVWKSTDAGATWRDTGQVFARGGGLTRIYGLTVGTNGRVIATTDARNSPVYISDNQGETWNFPNTPPPGLASGTGLAAIERLPGGGWSQVRAPSPMRRSIFPMVMGKRGDSKAERGSMAGGAPPRFSRWAAHACLQPPVPRPVFTRATITEIPGIKWCRRMNWATQVGSGIWRGLGSTSTFRRQHQPSGESSDASFLRPPDALWGNGGARAGGRSCLHSQCRSHGQSRRVVLRNPCACATGQRSESKACRSCLRPRPPNW